MFRSVILLGAALLVGCSRGPAHYPVHGSVTWQGKPVEEALVVFHPLDANGVVTKPIANTNAAGEFELTSLRAGDGALPGKYAVTVELRKPIMVGEELVRNGPNLLPPRYAKAETSQLSCEVLPGNNPPVLFELKR